MGAPGASAATLLAATVSTASLPCAPPMLRWNGRHRRTWRCTSAPVRRCASSAGHASSPRTRTPQVWSSPHVGPGRRAAAGEGGKGFQWQGRSSVSEILPRTPILQCAAAPAISESSVGCCCFLSWPKNPEHQDANLRKEEDHKAEEEHQCPNQPPLPTERGCQVETVEKRAEKDNPSG